MFFRKKSYMKSFLNPQSFSKNLLIVFSFFNVRLYTFVRKAVLFILFSLSFFSFSLNNNIKTCKLVSHQWKLMDGELSDYWAQELIGSDLLREELEKTLPLKIRNWVAIFDSRQGNHNIHVKNLISDEGPHAILPELGDETIPFFQTILIKQYKNILSFLNLSFLNTMQPRIIV